MIPHDISPVGLLRADAAPGRATGLSLVGIGCAGLLLCARTGAPLSRRRR